jgi:hypothetical protein
LLTPYKTENKEAILIACDHQGGDKTECIGYRSNCSIVDGYSRIHIEIKKPHVRYTTTFVSLQITLAVPSVKTTNKSSFQNIKSCALVKLTPLCEQKIGTSSYALYIKPNALVIEVIVQ